MLWISLHEGNEGSYVPNCQTNLDVVFQEQSLMFFTLHKHNSLTLGLI